MTRTIPERDAFSDPTPLDIRQADRGFTPGTTGLTFLATGIGMLIGVGLSIDDNKRYIQLMRKNKGVVAVEEKLRMMAVGAVLIPIGLAWFAASVQVGRRDPSSSTHVSDLCDNQPNVHYIVPLLVGPVRSLSPCGQYLTVDISRGPSSMESALSWSSYPWLHT